MEKFNWKNKKVLVTGADGFIGSHLSEQLVKLGAKVRAMVYYNAFGRWGWLDSSDLYKEMDIFLGDITDRDSAYQAVSGQEIIFHLAALIGIPYSYHAPASYVQTNIMGTLNLLQAAKEMGVKRFIQTSTSETYGTAQYTPIDEKHPLQGQSPYAASKIGADKMVESFYLSFNLPTIIVRPFNTYGPRQSARAVIPAVITQALTKKVVDIGATSPIRDLSYVQDVVSGFIAAGETGRKAFGEVFNIGSGNEISIADLAQLIVRLIGKRVRIKSVPERFRPEKSEVTRLLADNTKARNILGWKPNFDLEKGLEQTIKWFRNPKHLNLYKIDRYII
ncbi:MAG: NAD-dependent epimerase/dehydratase family protein [Candidatus Omnitrophica bacterium]|nr:NAD-dependent epimerase/dehydratase family protein [Candidatus Omnitrophota bacterium]